MYHSLSPLAAWKPHQRLETSTKTDTQEHVYQKPVRDVNELKQHLIETWSATSRASLIKRLISGKIVLMRISKPKTSIDICYNIYNFIRQMFLCNCHDFQSIRYCWYEQIHSCFVSHGRVRTAARRGGQFCCSFVANSLQYLCVKNIFGTHIFR